ncbi:MAG: hypothetical protein EWV67_09195 [Microcystis sp. M_QC_C_20170808_M2Col]|nr:MAG: hypothetical protein EWV67_09195 [Microcystis sp. M_QC_C_20170808_M2Col]TRT70998.1 MAG: hypothetical protein EWV68_05690 [Microcystis sp. M_QC_C_20170808_M9Col]
MEALFCNDYSTNTKSVEYRLHIRTGTHAKGRINNQFLITGFTMTTIFDFCRRAIESRNTRSLR